MKVAVISIFGGISIAGLVALLATDFFDDRPNRGVKTEGVDKKVLEAATESDQGLRPYSERGLRKPLTKEDVLEPVAPESADLETGRPNAFEVSKKVFHRPRDIESEGRREHLRNPVDPDVVNESEAPSTAEPASQELLLDLAQRISVGNSNPEALKKEVEQILAKDKENSTAWTLKAQIHMMQGELDLADEALGECLSDSSGAMLCMEARVTSRILQGDRRGFHQAREECLERYPDSKHCANPIGNFFADKSFDDLF